MISNRAGVSLVGSSRQDQLASRVALGLQPTNKSIVEGQTLGVGHDALGNFSFEIGFTSSQPDWQHEKVKHVHSKQFEHCLVQQVGPDQRTVQIDAQGLCGTPQSHIIMISRDAHNIYHPQFPLSVSLQEKGSGFIEIDVQFLGLIFTVR